MQYASEQYERDIRLEAALYVGAMCRTSTFTVCQLCTSVTDSQQVQAFMSCNGLATLSRMLAEDYEQHRNLVWMAVDSLSRILESQVRGSVGALMAAELAAAKRPGAPDRPD